MHGRLGHYIYGKMQLLYKMVLGLPTISSIKGFFESGVFSKHHKEKIDKDKFLHSKEKIQLIHSDICGPPKNSLFIL